MLEFDFRNVTAEILGETHGLDIETEFNNYNDKIAKIINDLNSKKDKPGQWLQWLNLGYSEETVNAALSKVISAKRADMLEVNKKAMSIGANN